MRKRKARGYNPTRAGGGARSVQIVSEKGRPCTVLNPWPGAGVLVHRNGEPAEILRGERLDLATTPGERLDLAMG